MTEAVQARDWLVDLQGCAEVDDRDGFQNLIVAIAKARPDLEPEVCRIAGEYIEDGETWAADFFKKPFEEQKVNEPDAKVDSADGWGKRRSLREVEEDRLERPKPLLLAPTFAAERKKLNSFLNTNAALTKAAPTQPVQNQSLTVVQPDFEPRNASEYAIKEMNNKHAIISNLGGKCVVMEWKPSAIIEGETELAYQSFSSFKDRYLNRYIEMPNVKGLMRGIPTAPYWLSHPDRRQYEGLDIVPNGPAVLPNGYLNLWRGWGVDPKPGSWKLLRRHVEEVLANGSQIFADYMFKHTAWKFQNPGLPPEVVIALLGGKGSGKGVWGHALMKIFGQHGLQIFTTNHLTGKHNAHLQNRLFLFLDEAMWAGDTAADRVLKGITTEKWMLIEPKNVDAFQWPNRLSILMSGNAKWIVPASHDERRYAVNKINEKWKQNKTYFAPLFEEINNGGAAAMLYDLLQIDLDGWHPRDNVPQTKTLLEQKQLGLTGLEQWWCHLISVGELPWPAQNNPRYAISENLLENAKDQNPRNKFLTADELGRFLREMGCKHKSNGKKWGWVFPPLPEARETWRSQSGEWEWLAPEIEEWGEKPAKEE